MSDRHVRLLRAVAKRRQQQSDAHAAAPVDAEPTRRGLDLRRAAALSRARLTASEARRDDEPSES